jgi:hypothetical protein
MAEFDFVSEVQTKEGWNVFPSADLDLFLLPECTVRLVTILLMFLFVPHNSCGVTNHSLTLLLVWQYTPNHIAS